MYLDDLFKPFFVLFPILQIASAFRRENPISLQSIRSDRPESVISKVGLAASG
jgi:hypothetical protein